MRRYLVPLGRASTRRRLAAAALAGTVSIAPGAAAQRPIAPVGPAVRPAPALTRAERDSLARAAVDDGLSRTEVVGLHVLGGSFVGASVGLLAAFVETHTGSYSDHSEDSLAYAFYGGTGALAGAIIGGIVGLVRTAPKAAAAAMPHSARPSPTPSPAGAPG